MFSWVRANYWLPEIAFTVGAILLFGTFDYLIQGINGLLVAMIFAMVPFFFRKAVVVSVFLLAAASFGVYWYSLAPVFGAIAPLISLFLQAVENHSTRSRFVSLAATGLAFGFVTFVQVQRAQISLVSHSSTNFGWANYVLAEVTAFSLVFGAYAAGRLFVIRDSHVGSGEDLLHLQNIADSNRVLVSELEGRLNIAEDISELVIQNISAVISRAEGGIYSAKSNAQSAIRSLERVLENAQNANNEVRRLNDLLRQQRGVSTTPPGLSDLENLSMRYREQGFSCSYSNEGKPFDINQGAQLAVYRIIFEALRYFALAAPKGSTLSADLIWSENGLQVLIKDNSTSITNRTETSSEEADVQYSVLQDLNALVKPIDNEVIAACRARASIYGGSADLLEVPGVGQTLSAYFPDLRLIASDSSR